MEVKVKEKNKVKNWWSKKDTQDKIWFFIKSFLWLVSLTFFVLLAFGKFIFGQDSVIYNSINIFTGTGEKNMWLEILALTVIIITISKIARMGLKWVFSSLKKGKAYIDLICSFIKYVAVIVLVFMILKVCGVNTTALLAGVGILSLVVGLGAQPLIEDIIAGLFIVFEKVYDVGDIIVIDNFRGTVKEIGVRTTKIVDAGGDVKVVNNSDIKTLINMTNELSLAVCDVDIEYGESLEKVESIIKENLDNMRESIPSIVEGPYYKGVAKLGASGVTLRFFANCKEEDKYQTVRDMNRKIKLIFDENGINIPFTQVVLHKPVEFKPATNKQKKIADSFVAEQRDISKNLGEGSNDYEK